MKNLRTGIIGLALVAGLVSFSRVAHGATAYYVSRTDVYVRSHAQGYAMGRLYTNDRMDIQYIDSNSWGYGYAYGHVNRCVWAKYREDGAGPNFRTHGTRVSNRCRENDKYLKTHEFSNGQIWNAGGDDGVLIRLPKATHMWDNWVWGGRWGNHHHRGVAAAGSVWKIRYITNDGGGVMARRCRDFRVCFDDWVFIQRSSLN